MLEATSPDDNLPRCALLMARVAYPELDPAPFLRQLQQMGATARDHIEIGLGGSPPRRTRLRIVTEYVYGQLGFVGNHERSRRPAQQPAQRRVDASHGHPDHPGGGVPRRRTSGRPWPSKGVNFPGHFLVRSLPDGDDRAELASALLVDPFHAGVVPHRRRVRAAPAVGTSAPRLFWNPGCCAARASGTSLLRMLLNLKRAFVRLRSLAQAHAVTELLVALDPAALTELAK